uniref:Uncharacterized protein n=1 Tax=Anguilla anguilla TaxID=7936 RepID=A0A0E9UZI5_ANGAN
MCQLDFVELCLFTYNFFRTPHSSDFLYITTISLLVKLPVKK